MTDDEMLKAFYKKQHIDTSKMERNDHRSFDRLKKNEDYNELRLDVVKQLFRR